MNSYRIVVDGLVQGVGFRVFTYREAQRLDLKGHVRNLGDGSVEVVAEGDTESVHKLISRLWEGPAAAQVASVDIHEYAGGGHYDKFEVRHG